MCGESHFLPGILHKLNTVSLSLFYQPANRNSNKTCEVSMKAEREAKTKTEIKENEHRSDIPVISDHLQDHGVWVGGQPFCQTH